MNYKRPSEDVHLNLITTRIRGYNNDGHTNIKADHTEDYIQPDEIYDHIPDITSSKDGIMYITEAETEETIGTEETAKQWKSFSNYASEINGKFHVVVPESCLEDAQYFAEQEGINIDYWYYNTDY